jgi:hypothetical protein
MRSLPLHHHTMGDAPYVRFRRIRRGGRELPTVPPTPFRQFYALRQPSTDLAGRNRTWRCHPRCERCRFIHTPWVTPPTFGFVVFDGGGENYLPFHQPHSGDFMPYANHQQIWPVEIARGSATPDAIVAASSTHHGRLPLRSVSSESMGGASNWGGSLPVYLKIVFNTHNNQLGRGQ